MIAADVTLVVSEFERDLLVTLLPALDVRVLSLIHSPAVTTPHVNGRSDVVFVGGYRHPPNVDAAVWAATRIMPLVRQQIPGATLRLIGPDAPPEVLELAGPGIDVVGWVADLGPEYASTRVVIAPLRYGAGVKGKVAEAIEYGVPLVGTSVALEGMRFVDGVDVLVADREEQFADHVVALLRDDERWTSMAGRGQQRLVEQFSPQLARSVLEGILDPETRPVRQPAVAGSS